MALKRFDLNIGQIAQGVVSQTGKAGRDLAQTIGTAAAGTMGKAKSTANSTVDKAKSAANNTMDVVRDKLDVNGDGNFDIEDLIIMSLRVPGVRINRSDFLRSEFARHYPEETIDDAILHTPARAGISREDIDRIAENVIRNERNGVTGISAALGLPGGAAMAATIPADIAQYYGYMMRAAQKLMYLYGFPEIDTREKGQSFDSETINLLTLCLGVMYGVAGANNAIKAMAKALATGVEKKLIRAALTRGTFYPIVKSVARWFGVHMTKEVFAGFFKKAIPVVGGVLGDTLTFVSFKPCCDKLKASLRETMLAGSEQSSMPEEVELILAELQDEESTDSDEHASEGE